MNNKRIQIKKNIASPIVDTIKGNLINQYHCGDGDNVAKNKNATNIHSSPELIKIGDYLQPILEELEQVYNPSTKIGEKKIVTEAIQKIDNNPNLVKRIVNVSQQALFAYLQARLISPVQSAFLAALEEWRKDK